MKKDEIIQYWIKSSDEDFEVMIDLFNLKKYSYALFFGHLVIEKLLKAYYVKNVEINVPKIHDLLKLADKSNIELTDEQKVMLKILIHLILKPDMTILKKNSTKNAIKNSLTKILKKLRK
jgi:HEPN domain-containing protein